MLNADPEDYIGISQTLVLEAGESQVCVNISIAADDILESLTDEFFLVNLSSIDSSVIVSFPSATVFIIDTSSKCMLYVNCLHVLCSHVLL